MCIGVININLKIIWASKPCVKSSFIHETNFRLIFAMEAFSWRSSWFSQAEMIISASENTIAKLDFAVAAKYMCLQLHFRCWWCLWDAAVHLAERMWWSTNLFVWWNETGQSFSSSAKTAENTPHAGVQVAPTYYRWAIGRKHVRGLVGQRRMSNVSDGKDFGLGRAERVGAGAPLWTDRCHISQRLQPKCCENTVPQARQPTVRLV